MINTNGIINSIKSDIKRNIELEQKRLEDISKSYEETEQFLLENGYDDVKEDDDVIIEVMKTIKNMKEQVVSNDTDIKNIGNSIHSLKSISSGIDEEIIKSLEGKIKSIKEDNSSTDVKLKNIKSSLDNLLSLQIVCPSCNGKVTSSTVTHNSYTTKGCAYCDSVGVVNIAKVLEKSNLLEVDFKTTGNRFENGFFNNGIYSNKDNNSDVLKSQPQVNVNVDKKENNNNRFVISAQ